MVFTHKTIKMYNLNQFDNMPCGLRLPHSFLVVEALYLNVNVRMSVHSQQAICMHTFVIDTIRSNNLDKYSRSVVMELLGGGFSVALCFYWSYELWSIERTSEFVHPFSTYYIRVIIIYSLK